MITPSADEPDRQDPEQLQADIARTRQRLGESVDALAARLDVASRAQHAARRARRRAQDGSRDGLAVLGAAGAWARSAVTDRSGRPRPATMAVAAVALGGVAAGSVAAVRSRRRPGRDTGPRRHRSSVRGRHRGTGHAD